jgi:hypothetical protein
MMHGQQNQTNRTWFEEKYRIFFSDFKQIWISSADFYEEPITNLVEISPAEVALTFWHRNLAFKF